MSIKKKILNIILILAVITANVGVITQNSFCPTDFSTCSQTSFLVIEDNCCSIENKTETSCNCDCSELLSECDCFISYDYHSSDQDLYFNKINFNKLFVVDLIIKDEIVFDYKEQDQQKMEFIKKLTDIPPPSKLINCFLATLRQSMDSDPTNNSIIA